MKTTFPAPISRRIFLIFSRFLGLTEPGQAIGLPTQQLPASPGYPVGQGTLPGKILPGNQRFLRAQ